MKICANCGSKQGERVGRHMMEKPPAVEVGKEEKKGKRILHFSYLSI